MSTTLTTCLTPSESKPSLCPEIDSASPLLFIINAASGSNNPDTTRHTIEEALRAAGRTGKFLRARPDELACVATQAAVTAIAQRTAVVAVGGDGTINSVAQAVHAEGCAMGIVPQGTFNYFARTHGIPTNAADAAQALLYSVPSPVQVGLINDRVFLVNASLGLYPELLQEREVNKARFGRSRLVAIGSACVTLLARHRQMRLSIELGAIARNVTTPTLIVGNNRLQLEQMGLHEAHALDEGWIEAVMLRPIGMFSMLMLLFRGAIGTFCEASTVESFKFHHMVVAPRLVLMGHRTVKVALDGEVLWMRVPLDFRVSPKPLYLLKPKSEKVATGLGQDGS